MLDLFAFAGVMALGQFSPGPDMLLLTRTSLAEGAAQGVRMALGIATGLSVHAAVAVGGAAVVFDRSPELKLVLTWLAAAYLGWLAIRLANGAAIALRAGSAHSDPDTPTTGSAYRRGLLCNLLNPKVALFLAAAAAPFLQGDRPAWWPAGLWAVIVIEGFLLWSLWAWVLQSPPIRAGYRRVGPWLDLGFATALAGLAIVLVAGALR
jgi:threonine/homoserine/homoserine lactone efflux protein